MFCDVLIGEDLKDDKVLKIRMKAKYIQLCRVISREGEDELKLEELYYIFNIIAPFITTIGIIIFVVGLT